MKAAYEDVGGRPVDAKSAPPKAGWVRVNDLTSYKLDGEGMIVKVMTRAKSRHERERQLALVVCAYGYMFTTWDWCGEKPNLKGNDTEFTLAIKNPRASQSSSGENVNRR